MKITNPSLGNNLKKIETFLVDAKITADELYQITREVYVLMSYKSLPNINGKTLNLLLGVMLIVSVVHRTTNLIIRYSIIFYYINGYSNFQHSKPQKHF